MAEAAGNTRESKSTTPMNILLFEPQPHAAEKLMRMLEGPDFAECSCVHCASESETRAWLGRKQFDVALIGAPIDAAQPTLASQLQARFDTPAFITLSDAEDELLGIGRVRGGAQDHLVKSRLSAHCLRSSLLHAVERNRLRQQLASSRRAESEIKDRVLSHVSHELRTPLTAAAQFVGILRDGIAGELSQQQREYVSIVDRNIDQLKRMIGDLMDVARVSSGKLHLDMGLVDIDACVAEAIDAVSSSAAQKHVELRSYQPQQLPRVFADRERTLQVLGNLLSNAIKFTPAGGTITVQVSTHADGFLQVAVNDTGCGIEAEKLERIFERLEQAGGDESASRKGLGLGLYICRELVRSMGGEICVDSVPRGGTTFFFTLPVYSSGALLRRLLGDERPETLTLTTVLLRRPPNRETKQAPQSVLREAARLLEECHAPHDHVLVPESRDSGSSSSVLALSKLDAAGAAALERRLEERIAPEWSPLNRFGCEVELHCEPFALAGEDREWTFQNAHHEMRKRLDERGVPALVPGA